MPGFFATIAPALTFGNKALNAGLQAHNIFKSAKNAANRIDSAKKRDALAQQKELEAQEQIKNKATSLANKNLAKTYGDYKAIQNFYKKNPVGTNKFADVMNKPITPTGVFGNNKQEIENSEKSSFQKMAMSKGYKLGPNGWTKTLATPNANSQLQTTLDNLKAKGLANQQKISNASQKVQGKYQNVPMGQPVPKFSMPPSNAQIQQKALGKPKTDKIGPVALTYKQNQKPMSVTDKIKNNVKLKKKEKTEAKKLFGLD